MRVTLSNESDALVFRDSRFSHRGEGWVTRLEGWYGALGIDTDLQRMPGRSGCYAPGLYTSDARTVTLGIAWRCRSDIETAGLLDRLDRMTSGVMTLTVEDPHGRRHASCHLSDQIEPSFAPNGAAAWTDIIMTCPDPLKYGDPVPFRVSGGRVRVENRGTMGTLPVIRVERAQGLSFLSVTDGDGHEVAWEGDGSATGLDLDFNSLNPGVGRVTVDDAFTVTPGVSDLYVSADNGATAVVLVSPAWR